MAQELRVVTTLTKDPCLGPTNHTVARNHQTICGSGFRRSIDLVWPLWALVCMGVGVHIYRHIHINKRHAIKSFRRGRQTDSRKWRTSGRHSQSDKDVFTLWKPREPEIPEFHEQWMKVTKEECGQVSTLIKHSSLSSTEWQHWKALWVDCFVSPKN